MTVLLVALCVGVAVAAGRSDAIAPNPIRKIVTLLQDMQKEVAHAGKQEEELFDKFMCFCDQGVGGLQKTASDAAAQIEDSSAKLEEETSEKSQLEQDLTQHTTDRTQATEDLGKATALREKESSGYQAESASQKSSLDSLGKAIPALEKNLAAASLVQAGDDVPQNLRKVVQSSLALSSSQRQTVLSFLDGKSEESSPGGGEIVGIMKTIKDEMQKSYDDGVIGEETSAKGFGDLKGAKDTEIKLATQSIEDKGKRVGELGVLVVQRQDTIDDATVEKADAEKFASTLDVDCANKKKEWAERTKLRNDEILAISEAINILNDDSALDTFSGAQPALMQQAVVAPRSKTGTFLQGRTTSQAAQLQKASAFLATIAARQSSPLRLKFLVYSMQSRLRSVANGKQPEGGVDFGAIIKSIDEMMEVLNGETTDDEKKKEFCRGEFDKSGDEAKATQDKLDRLAASIEQMNDEVAELADEVKALTDGIAALDKEVAESTAQRKAEHAEYLETTQLTDAAGQLLKKAKNRLVKFYNPALHKPEAEEAAPASFFQSQSSKHSSKVAPPEAPETPEGPYKPNKKSGGIMALMDEMTLELAMSLQEAQLAEKQAQGGYVALMQEAQETREHDSKSITSKSAAKAALQSKVTDAKESKASTLEALDNVHQYIADLHGSCDFLMENFDARKEARASELDGLRNAKASLSGAK